MRCLRCEGTGIDPQAQCWDDPNYNRCVECDYGQADFKTWIRQVLDLLMYKIGVRK